MGAATTATAATACRYFVGIDVSKATLDACLLAPGGEARGSAFANDAAGHAALAAWADRHAGGEPARFCLEATGAYSEPPAPGAGRRRPARQRRQPDPRQVRRADARPGQQDRRRRRPADRRVRLARAAAGVVPAAGGGARAAGPRAPAGRPARDGRPREGAARRADLDQGGPPADRAGRQVPGGGGGEGAGRGRRGDRARAAAGVRGVRRLGRGPVRRARSVGACAGPHGRGESGPALGPHDPGRRRAAGARGATRQRGAGSHPVHHLGGSARGAARGVRRLRRAGRGQAAAVAARGAGADTTGLRGG